MRSSAGREAGPSSAAWRAQPAGRAPRAPRAVLIAASRRGVKLAATRLQVEVRTVGREVCELLDIDPGTEVTTVFRVLVASGQPAAVMFDVVHPSVALPDPPRLLRKLEGGQMVLDVLSPAGIPVAFAQTRASCPRWSPRARRWARPCRSGARRPRSSSKRSCTSAPAIRWPTRAICSLPGPSTSA